MGGNPVIPFPCGGPGQPACPPVQAITKKKDGHFYAVIDGVEYKLVPQAEPVLEDPTDTVQD